MISSVKDPDLALAGLALLVIFGLLIWRDRTTESAHPFDLYTQHQDLQTTGYAYESWLWQDPFGFEPPDREKESEEGECKHQLEKITDPAPVKIFAPLLRVRSNTVDIENRELRTRDRYAVIAGLIESGYRPLEPDRLHFCSIQKNGSDKEYGVRWEHFRYESKYQLDKDTSGKNETNQSDKKPDIIVVWMNSEIFKTDDNKFTFDKFTLEFENSVISEETHKYIFDLNNVLGSKDLENIIDKTNEKKYKNIQLFNLGGHYEKAPPENDKADNEKLTEDEELTKKLTEELKLRNIKESSDIIVITEQDSEKARDLYRNFSKSFCKPVKAESSACEIKNILYLKGVDPNQQIIDKQDKKEDHQAANKRADRRPLIGLHNPSPLPAGSSQLDYFRRLAKQINDSHKEINLEKRDSGRRAVGIFGSDFYDKLLILEALRAEMPNILVFTTGLDAQMLHPRHWASTRNLVVASNFNLLLRGGDKEDQEQFPVFRDSQQTNIFYRTIEIVTSDVTRFEIPSPKIFEIGRNGPVRLGQVPVHENDLSYHNVLEQAKTRLGLLAVIIFTLIVFYWLIIRPNSGRLSLCLFFSTWVIFASAWIGATNESGEPLSFTDGTSLWPTVFIQSIAIWLAFAFFVRARRELDENFCGLSRQYFPSLSRQDFRVCWRDCEPWLLSGLGSESGWFYRWPFRLIILTSLTFFITSSIYAINDVFPSSWLSFWPCFWLLLLFAIVYLYIIERKNERKKDGLNLNFNSIKDWIEKDNCQPTEANQDKNSCRIRRALDKFTFFHWNTRSRRRSSHNNYEDVLWREYYHYGLLDHRVSRVVGIWLFFAIIETMLIYLLPPWPLPCRGPTCGLVSWIGVISFVVIMTLLFFVLDAVRLSFYWIQKLRKQHPLLDKKNSPQNLNVFNKPPFELLENIVEVVAERTRVVDQLIYYPMLCIMLMLFAKITYFDNQGFPLSKGITFAASISLLFFSGFMLRYEAKQLKRFVIKSAENLGKNNRGIQPEVDKAIKRINDICDGAFQPMFEQPVLRALLIISASTGIFAAKYLNLSG